jgi:hypothetical protein
MLSHGESSSNFSSVHLPVGPIASDHLLWPMEGEGPHAFGADVLGYAPPPCSCAVTIEGPDTVPVTALRGAVNVKFSSGGTVACTGSGTVTAFVMDGVILRTDRNNRPMQLEISAGAWVTPLPDLLGGRLGGRTSADGSFDISDIPGIREAQPGDEIEVSADISCWGAGGGDLCTDKAGHTIRVVR